MPGKWRLSIDKRAVRANAATLLVDKLLAYDCDWREAFGSNFDRVCLTAEQWDSIIKLAMKASMT